MVEVRALRASALFVMLAALAACAGDPARDRGGEGGDGAAGAHDPVMSAAIEGQLLVDPDLSQQNMRNMAVVPAGPVDPALPLPDPPIKP
jgi:hypothetical protein